MYSGDNLDKYSYIHLFDNSGKKREHRLTPPAEYIRTNNDILWYCRVVRNARPWLELSKFNDAGKVALPQVSIVSVSSRAAFHCVFRMERQTEAAFGLCFDRDSSMDRRPDNGADILLIGENYSVTLNVN